MPVLGTTNLPLDGMRKLPSVDPPPVLPRPPSGLSARTPTPKPPGVCTLKFISYASSGLELAVTTALPGPGCVSVPSMPSAYVSQGMYVPAPNENDANAPVG